MPSQVRPETEIIANRLLCSLLQRLILGIKARDSTASIIEFLMSFLPRGSVEFSHFFLATK